MTSKVNKGDRSVYSIIYAEISVPELRTVWRRSKLKNEIWHSGHNRNIALLKRTQKQVKIGYSVYIYKKTHIHSETILAVSPEIWFTELDELALLSENLFPSLMMDHNGFERQTRHFPATIKINWTNPA